MSTEEKRSAVLNAYPGGSWANKVLKMPDKQIHVVYMRLLNQGKLK